MYPIDATNLRWAYQKLKTYYYYYHSSLFLKKRIIEFENAITQGIISFEGLAEELNGLITGQTTLIVPGEVNFLVYPKKDAFTNRFDSAVIDDTRVDFYIDMDIRFFLVDILFSLDLFEATKNEIALGAVYSALPDQRMGSNFLENSFLFEHYQRSYKRWKNIPLECLRKNDVQGTTVVKLDLSSCFRSCAFDLHNVCSGLFEKNDAVVQIMQSIYWIYTKKVLTALDAPSKKKYISVLPVGLTSSSIILNYLMSKFDRELLFSKKVIGYGRYVDDMIIAFPGKLSGPLGDVLCTLFPNLFSNDATLSVNAGAPVDTPLPVNDKKTMARYYPQRERGMKEEDEVAFFGASFIDFDYEPQSNDMDSLTEADSLKELRAKTFQFIKKGESSIDEAFYWVKRRTNAELLNAYPLWEEWYRLFQRDDIKDSFEKLISEAIACIEKKNPRSQRVSLTLKSESEVASWLAALGSKDCFYITSITQEDIQEYIRNYLNKCLDASSRFFPYILTMADISLYLEFAHLGERDYPLLEKSMEILKEINRISDSFILPADSFTYQNACLTTDSAQTETCKATIALAALNMRDLSGCAKLSDEKPNTYSLYDLETLLAQAHEEHATYLLLPELSIDYTWIPPLISKARKMRITLIGGLLHFLIPGTDKVANLTLLFEAHSGLVFLKPKNYIAPKERYIIEDKFRKKAFTPATPYYIYVNDGTLAYSVATCFEVTNICDRSGFAGKINMLFLPVYNKDTSYFSSIIQSFARDLSCFVAQANANNLGDTRIRQPKCELEADIVRLKGGNNNYLVTGTVDVGYLRKCNEEYLRDEKNYSKSPAVDSGPCPFKPLSAGKHHKK